MMTFPAAAFQDNFIVVPYVSQAGADAGRKYMLFIVSYREYPNELIYKYDIERKEFTQIELPPHSTNYGTDSRGQAISGAVWNETAMALFTVRENKIVEWGHFDKWYENSEVVSTVEFQAIVGENRHYEKNIKAINLNPGESIDIVPYVSVNGLPPTIPLVQDVSQDSFWDCDRKLSGYLFHIKLVKSGGAGGKVFTSGLSVDLEELPPKNRVRGYLTSKTCYLDSMWEQGPPIIHGVASASDGVDETIPHGCPFRPIACFASLYRAGTLNSASEFLVTWDGTNIYVNYTGYQSGDLLHWCAIMFNASNPREGWYAEEQIYWRTRAQILDLSRNPGAVLLSRAAAPTNKRVYNPNTSFNSDTRLGIPLTGADTYPNLDYRQLGCGAFYSDNSPNNVVFSCGSQSVGNSDTNITHGLGVAPSTVLVTSHLAPGSAMPFVRGKNSTNITVRHTSSGRLDWVAFK